MKAIVYSKYGPPDVLQLAEVEKPTPNDKEVLVQVFALSLNPAESHMRKGEPMARLMGGTGLFKPKNGIPGADFSGRVEAAGRNVTQFKPGDEVLGRRTFGGFAEYLCISENSIALKPTNMSFEQAAAVPVAAVTALQSLRDTGHIQSGQKVLVNGAAGGVGTFTVQIAKAFGAHVTGVCSTRNLDLVRSLGAEQVIDYTRQDFTCNGQCYDLIVDNVGNRSVVDRARVLGPTGISVGVGFSSMVLLIQNMFLGQLISSTSSKKFSLMMAQLNKKDLIVLNELMEAGKIVPVIDRRYALQETAQAFRYLETRHAPGKIIINLGPKNKL